LGGDEFCVLLSAEPYELHHQLARADGAMHERGADYSVRASCGTVLLPHEASTPEQAMQLADQRMYAHKQRRPSGTRAQTRNVLLRIMGERDGGLSEHSIGVAALALAVARRLGMTANDLDELLRAAELHDIGKVAIPDSILEKPEALTPEEWRCMRQHTILGERILSAAPALRPVAAIVRATHERWDGRGYPDRLAGEQIPLAARIIAACDAYDAMTADRCYRPANDIGFAREELLREAGRQFDPVVVAAILDELDLAAPDGVADPLAEAAVGRRGTDEIADRLLEIIAGSAERSGPHEVKPQRRERRAPGFPQVLAAPTVEGTESHQREQR
jgi:putative nucleotidyltransferase with HDIG domain